MPTHTAASVSYADVKAKYDLCVDGDTLVIPAGSASWATCLNVTKNIIIQGSTTVVKNSATSYTITDGTIIHDNETGTAKKIANVIYCNYLAGASNPVIKGITFDGSTSTNTATAMLYIEGTHTSFRVTQCNFTKGKRYLTWKDGAAYGVFDHCNFEKDFGSEAIATHDSGFGGKTTGDGSWNEGPHFLNSDPKRAYATYYEDCQMRSFITGTGTVGDKHGSSDSHFGGRRVIRYCYMHCTVPALHGTESGGRGRGSRVVETYQNNINLVNSGSGNTGIQHRGGTGIYWGNTLTSDAAFSRNFQPIANRQNSPWPGWEMADGTSDLDSNDTEGDGTYVPGNSPHKYWPTSGTATNDVTADDRVHQTGAGWTTNQWAGAFVTNITTGLASQIASNTSETLILVAHWGGVKNTFTSGNTFEIYKLARGSLDQPGLGYGALISGIPPHTGDGNWAQENTEPLYQWMNTKNGSTSTTWFIPDADAPYITIQNNRDYFNQNGSFAPCTNPASTLSSGTGYGTFANRPHCTYVGGAQPQADGQIPYVAYWTTDTNKLYVSTGVDTWTLYYEPYTYPHPITGGATGKIIDVPVSHDFGNIIVGNTGSYSIPVANTGDATLSVASITYPTGYSGPATSFTVSPGATAIKIAVFAPLAATTYAGNVVLASDATSGNGTMAVTGVGVVESGGGGGGKGHKKGVLVARGR